MPELGNTGKVPAAEVQTGTWPSNPRERRAFAHVAIARARSNPSRPELIDQAEEAVRAAGTSRKSQASGFERALTNAAHDVWVANGSDRWVPKMLRGTALADMLVDGVDRVAIVVPNEDQATFATHYKDVQISVNPNADVKIIVDPKQKIPTYGSRGTRRVINYYWRA